MEAHRAKQEVIRFEGELVSTGVPQLNQMLGGGLARGTNTLLNGPSGVGKTTTAVRCALTAIERGEKAAYFLFDEGRATLFARAAAMGMDLQPYLRSGHIIVRQIDPAEMSPGEFVHTIREAVTTLKTTVIVIDSLNGYLNAMPDERFG